MHLADHGVARNAAEFRRDLARRKTVGPKLFEKLDPFVSPRHAQSSLSGAVDTCAKNPGSARESFLANRPPRQAARTARHVLITNALENCPHEMSYLTIKRLQYGGSRAQESCLLLHTFLVVCG